MMRRFISILSAAVLRQSRGRELSDESHGEEVLQDFKDTTESGPNDAYAWLNKGNALYRSDRLEEALQAYNRAIKIASA